MQELERLLNEAEANGANFPALRSYVFALWRHYQAAEGIINAYLDLPFSPEAAGMQSEIDANAVAWLNTVVKG